jgi:hypothetical protein
MPAEAAGQHPIPERCNTPRVSLAEQRRIAMAFASPRRPADTADEELKVETEIAQATGQVSPINWWGLSLIALFIIAAILLGIQLLGGNRQTAVIPGTPITAPQINPSVPQS